MGKNNYLSANLNLASNIKRQRATRITHTEKPALKNDSIEIHKTYMRQRQQ